MRTDLEQKQPLLEPSQRIHHAGGLPPVESSRDELISELRQKRQTVQKHGWWEWGLSAALGAAVVGMLYCVMIESLVQVGFQSSGSVFFSALVVLLLLAWLARDRARQAYLSEFDALIETVQRHLLTEKAIRDRLTGAFNREGLEEIAPTYLRNAERSGKPLALIFVDLDFFHELNSRFGHAAGDTALIEFARLLHNSVRGSDLVARFGGDEFVLLLPETELAGVDIVVRRIRDRLSSWNPSNGEAPLAFTSGAAQLHTGMDLKALLEEADRDLLRRKQQRPDTGRASAGRR